MAQTDRSVSSRYCLTGRVFGFALAAIACFCAPVRGQNAESGLTNAMRQCCTTSSYRQGDPRSLNLTSRMDLTLTSYLKNPALTFHKPPLTFFQDVARLTGVDFTINPLASDLRPVISRLTVAALPALRSDLPPEALADLRQRFADLSDVRFAVNGPKGIDGLLDTAYAGDGNMIVAERTRSEDGRVSTATVFARPKRDEDVEVIMKRAVLEGFGYDADGTVLTDSIFVNDGSTDLTDRDKTALQALYRR